MAEDQADTSDQASGDNFESNINDIVEKYFGGLSESAGSRSGSGGRSSGDGGAAARKAAASAQKRALAQQMEMFQQELEFKYTALGIEDENADLDRDLKREMFTKQMRFQLLELKARYEEIEIQRGRAAADAWYQQQQVRLTEQAHALRAGELGMEYLKTSVEYASTVDDYFKNADFQAGAKARADVPLFMDALMRGQAAGSFNSWGNQPAPKNLDDLARGMGWSGSTSKVGEPWTPPPGMHPGDPGNPIPAGSGGFNVDRAADYVGVSGDGSGGGGGSGNLPFRDAESARSWYRNLNDDDPLRQTDKTLANKDMTYDQWRAWYQQHAGSQSQTPSTSASEVFTPAAVPASVAAAAGLNYNPQYSMVPTTEQQTQQVAAAPTPPPQPGGYTTTQAVAVPASVAAAAGVPQEFIERMNIQGWSPQDQGALYGASKLYQRGFSKIQPGGLEQTGKQKVKALLAAGKRMGVDVDLAMQDYVRSRAYNTGSARQA